MSTSPLTFEVSTSSRAIDSNAIMVYGAQDLVLFDTCMTVPDAHDLVERIRATGRRLREVHITHAHPDHYFGIEVIREAFPGTPVYSHRGTVEALSEWPSKVRHWAEVFGPDLLPWHLSDIEARDDSPIEIEGHSIEVIDLFRTEAVHMRTFLHAETGTFICGDFLYNGMHVLTADVGHFDGWLEELRRVKDTYQIARVMMGHGAPCGPEVIDFCIGYLEKKRDASTPGASVREVAEAMLREYPDLYAPPVLYWTRGPGFGFLGPASVGVPEDMNLAFGRPED